MTKRIVAAVVTVALPAAGMLLASLLGAAAPVDDAAVQRAQRRGMAIAQYDRAAWVSTDDIRARLPADRQGEVGGWIVTPASNGLHVNSLARAPRRSG